MNEKLSMQIVAETTTVSGKYETPVVFVTYFTSEDVIRTSREPGNDYGNTDWA